MAKTNDHTPLFPDGIYHVCNRVNGNEQLFHNEDNFHFFLRRYQQHISPVADLYAWGLLPNHSHILIQVRPPDIVAVHYREVKGATADLPGEGYADFVTERFSNWLNSYTKAFNKVFNRKGSLFMHYLRRVHITSDQQLAATVFYIHRNPVQHGYCKHIGDWQWSSYHEYMTRRYEWVNPCFVQRFFGTLGMFKHFHSQPIFLKAAQILE